MAFGGPIPWDSHLARENHMKKCVVILLLSVLYAALVAAPLALTACKKPFAIEFPEEEDGSS
jgi:hypothetical protein